MDKKQALSIIDARSEVIIEVNDRLWENPETAFQEFISMDILCDALAAQGFEVEKGVADVPTAFTGRFGSGKPVIGFLGEYDALSGLSQEGGVAVKTPIVPGGPGHGCGHNNLGAGSLAAVMAVKHYLENNPGKSGTVIYFGCPGEEGGSGKAFMAREGVFDECDACITWHPASTFNVRSGSNLANVQIEYQFKGVSAHAAGDPHLGRSALDAVELMNVGVQFLREHMIDSARIHYAITDAGGYSPNVVQPEAQVLYMVRSQKVGQALDLLKRLDKIAEGAALMTETTLKRRFIDGTSNTVPNFTLEKLLYDNFAQIGVPSYTEEEKALAAALIKTYENPRTVLPGFAANQDPEIGEYVKSKIADGRPLNDFLVPYYSSTAMRMGSTDVGDVSWICPTAQITTVTQASNSPGHSWQNVAIGNTSIAHKGVLCASRVLAGAAIDIYENPDIEAAAKAEWEKKLGGESYCCLSPPMRCPSPWGIRCNKLRLVHQDGRNL